MAVERPGSMAGARRAGKAAPRRTRREVFGEEPLPQEEESSPSVDYEEDDFHEVEPLPPTRVPVISLILKTKLSTQFDVLMNEMERVQERVGVRVVIVHGGLGPVVPKDVTHAEVEKNYGFCPIYAFQVGSHPAAISQAERERIDIRKFTVFTDLVADIEARCSAVHYKAESEGYLRSLKTQPTSSGW